MNAETNRSTVKGTAAFYDKTAADWAQKGYSDGSGLPCLLDFVRAYQAGSRFLDLCCGAGYETRRIHAAGYDAVGIDFSEESLKIARSMNPSLSFYHDNLLNDYSYIGKVDAIVIIAGLVHIETEDLSTAFRRMRAVLKESGRVFLSVWHGIGKIPERSFTELDGEAYDRNFIAHTLEELNEAAKGVFTFEQEVGVDGSAWHYYIFQASAQKMP